MVSQLALGMIFGAGIFSIILGMLRRPPELGDALDTLDRLSAIAPKSRRILPRLTLPIKTLRLLEMQDKTMGEFFAQKVAYALAGLLLPGLWHGLRMLFGYPFQALPLILAPVLATAGFFLPDWLLRRDQEQLSRAMSAAVHTFFDLVILERLANASAAQAAATAAKFSDTSLFRRISAGIERARMEQVPPWDEIRVIADYWQLPELHDFADVMQLEEQGAALADTLQARVKELRDAHLTQLRIENAQASERMTLWMTVPALVLALAFLAPALLRITNM